MPISILMPALSPTMETGTLTKWYVKEGSEVSSGDILAEIETDKATMDFESVEDGVITKILIREGEENIAVNEVIAELTRDDEDKKIEESKQNNISNLSTAVDTKLIEVEPVPLQKNSKIIASTFEKSKTSTINDRIKISPLAKKIAKNKNIDITKLTGSGPHGRIVKNDILSTFKSMTKDSSSEATISKNLPLKESRIQKMDGLNDVTINYQDREYTITKLSGMRKAIADRLVESKSTIPHFYLRRSINVNKLLSIRSELNESLKPSGVKLSINDFIIKASAKSLQEHPNCNSIWAHDHIINLKPSDISVAVAIDEGLITPIIRDAEKKSLQDISSEIKELAQKAKLKRLLPTEYIGGGFSISNLGMMGVENFDAVINPPQASILAVGSTEKKALVATDDSFYVGNVMSLTLSADHRVIDGAVGASFLSSIAEYLSNPLKLLL